MDFKKILFKTSTIDVEKALPNGIIFFGKDGKIQWVNDKAAQLLETSKMHLLTSNINDFIENAVNLVGNAVLIEKPIITKLIDKETYFDTTTKEIDEGFVIDFREVADSERITAEISQEEANYVNRDKNAFLTKLANDFKSPLQSIVGFSQAMADGLGGNMSIQQEKYINIIKKNSLDLMYFTSKMLELSETELNLNKPEYRTFDIQNLITSVTRFNEQLFKDKSVRWNLKIDENSKNTIISDEDIIKNILQNIIEVVLKSIDMGEVSITLTNLDEDFINSKNLSPEKDYVKISIASTSLLLSDNDLESMFDPYKIIDTTNRKNLLRAMILASVKNRVQSLSGFIWVESTILKSASFNIVIPQDKQ